MEKFVINSIVSATHTGTMGGSDQKAIIDKIKSAGRDDNNSSNDNPTPETNDSKSQDDNGNGNTPETNTNQNTKEDKSTSESIKKKLHMSEINRTFAKKEDMIHNDNLDVVINEVFSLMGSDPQKETEPDKQVETPVQTPEKDPDKGIPEPTRRSKPWIIEPSIQPNPEPKASK